MVIVSRILKLFEKSFTKNFFCIVQNSLLEGVQRIGLTDGMGAMVASIENLPGKQGSVAVYQYLGRAFDVLDADAAAHGLAVFGEHTADARKRSGAHPNIDRLLEIVGGGDDSYGGRTEGLLWRTLFCKNLLCSEYNELLVNPQLY